MTDEQDTYRKLGLSRRRVLGSLGVIGGSAALGGLGTTAFFSDEENFAGNTLTSGALDLKLDWEEHYSDWSDDEEEAVSDVIMLDDGESVPDGYVGLPTAADPLIAIPEEDLDAFMDATALEAYPDVDDDGLQDAFNTDYDLDGDGSIDVSIGDICEDGADTPEDLDPTTSLRTENEDTVLGDGSTAPLVNLTDVKPGDFGEVTFSLHLCDNPGYLWVNGELTEDADNGFTEPESKDPDEDGSEDGELDNEIMVALWYDHGSTVDWDGDSEEGDNVMQPNEAAVEFENTAAIGGLRTVMDLLGTNDGLGIPLDGDLSSGFTEIQPVGCGKTVGSGSADNITELVCATEDGNQECSDFDLLEAIKIEEGKLTEGEYATPAGTVTVESFDSDGGTVTLSTDFPVSAIITKGGNDSEVCKADGDANGIPLEEKDGVTLDNVQFHTPLNENTDKDGDYYGLSHVSVCYEGEVPTDAQNGADGRDCFVNSTTVYLGFAWWLPVDHANEIQTDSVAFDLGFYTEQCRHNDGSGMANDV